MQVNVIDGDIARIEADAIVTAINPAGMWFGGIDGVIQRAAGDQYHSQAANALYAKPDIKTVVAEGKAAHTGMFKNVVFVIDDLRDSLGAVVERGLAAASDAAFATVSVPLIRFGVMKDVGGTVDSKLDETVAAVKRQGASPDNKIAALTIVVYGDWELSARLRSKLGIN